MIRAERCLTGRLASTYPAARHDIELQVDGVPAEELAAVLRREVDRVLGEDPACRKVVYAAPLGDHRTTAAAESAGFRIVVDVDVPIAGGRTEALTLLVREPTSVAHHDEDLGHVPEG